MINQHPPKQRWITLAVSNFWENMRERVGDRHFGVVKSSEGRGSMKFVGYYGPEEDREGFFAPIKALLLAAVRDWLSRGWLTKQEVQETLTVEVTPPARTKVKRATTPPKKAAPIEVSIPTPAKAKKAKPVVKELSVKEQVAALKTMLDEDDKAKTLTKVKRALDMLDRDQVDGVEDVESAIEEYEDITRAGSTPEEYADDKQSAFEFIQESIDALEVAEA
jgi:hypothetical protein